MDAALSPMEVVEQVVAHHRWEAEKTEHDITIFIHGQWDEYECTFLWIEEEGVMHLSCAFELKVPKERIGELRKFIRLLNCELWFGHFEWVAKKEAVYFCQGVLCLPEETLSERHICELINRSMEACEQYYPAFGWVAAQGLSAEQALDGNIPKAVGHG